jgi:hypothetical protein
MTALSHFDNIDFGFYMERGHKGSFIDFSTVRGRKGLLMNHYSR